MTALIDRIAEDIHCLHGVPLELARRCAETALRLADRWQPIATAPAETEVLLYSEGLGMAVHPVEAIEAFGWDDITHWRPLPEPPPGRRIAHA